MRINEGFVERFLNGILKRKIDKDMKRIIKNDPKVARAVKDVHDANEKLRKALGI